MNKGILKGVFNFYDDIRVIDVLNDSIITLSYSNDAIVSTNKASYSEFLDKLSSEVKEEDLKHLTEQSSLNNLETHPNGIMVNYEKQDNHKYSSLYMLIDSARKLILMLTHKTSEISTNDKSRLSNFTDEVSDAILKIYNLFEANTSSNLNIDNVESYINAIFTNLTTDYKELSNALAKKAFNVSSRFGKTLMIVDDDMVTRGMLRKIFKDDYNIVEAANGNEAIEILDRTLNNKGYEKTDNIVGMFLDLTMPIADGFSVLDYMTNNNLLSNIPVIIISGDYEKETRNKAYNYNIADMIEKPFDFQIVRHRINKFINLYRTSSSLTNIVSDQYANTNKIIDNILKAYAYDYSDNIKKLYQYLNIIATQYKALHPEYGLDDEKIDKLSNAIKYYDLGIYTIPKRVFSKGNLTNEDKKLIINRVDAGCCILDVILKDNEDSLYKNYCYEILKYCHEYYSGKGYPYGLSGEKIPISAQLASICIDYLNLSSKNDHDECCNIISSNNNLKYSDEIINLFKSVSDTFKNI